MNEKNKKTPLNDFINKYKALNGEQAKHNIVKSIITRTYCPILEKKLIIEMMIDKSKVNGNTSYIDMVLAKINFYMAIIAIYTNLEIEKDENGIPKTMESYDILVKEDLFNSILDEIGERELGELMSINDAVLTTWHNEHSSIQAYVSGLVEKVSMIFSTAVGQKMQPIVDMFNSLSDEEKQNLFSLLKSE